MIPNGSLSDYCSVSEASDGEDTAQNDFGVLMEARKAELQRRLIDERVIDSPDELNCLVRDNILRQSESEWTDDLRQRCAEATLGGGTGLWHYNMTTHQWWLSAGISRVLGFDNDEFQNDPQNWLSRVHSDDKHDLLMAVKHHQRRKKRVRFHCRYRIRHRDGHWLPVRGAGMRMERPDGTNVLAGTMTVVSDEEFLAEHALNTMEHMLVFGKRRDKKGKIRFTFANRALAATFGRSPNQVIGKTDEDLGMPAEEIENFRKADTQILVPGAFGHRLNQVVVRRESVTPPGGDAKTLYTIKEAVDLPEGERQLVGVALDITDMTLLEERVQFEADLLENLLNAFNMSIWIKDLKGRFIRVNRHFAHRHGYDNPSDMLGETDFDHWSKKQAERFRRDDLEVITTRKIKEAYRETLHWKNGSSSRILTTKIPVVGSNQRVFAVLGMCEILDETKKAGKMVRVNSGAVSHARLIQTRDVLEVALRQWNAHFAASV